MTLLIFFLAVLAVAPAMILTFPDSEENSDSRLSPAGRPNTELTDPVYPPETIDIPIERIDVSGRGFWENRFAAGG